MADVKSPLPPEVVERANAKCMFPAGMGNRVAFESGVRAALSVIADYLRSEEARKRAEAALFEARKHYGVGNQVDAVIAALLKNH